MSDDKARLSMLNEYTDNPASRDDKRMAAFNIWRKQSPENTILLDQIEELFNAGELHDWETLRRTGQAIKKDNPDLKGRLHNKRQAHNIHISRSKQLDLFVMSPEPVLRAIYDHEDRKGNVWIGEDDLSPWAVIKDDVFILPKSEFSRLGAKETISAYLALYPVERKRLGGRGSNAAPAVIIPADEISNFKV